MGWVELARFSLIDGAASAWPTLQSGDGNSNPLDGNAAFQKGQDGVNSQVQHVSHALQETARSGHQATHLDDHHVFC